MHVGKKSQASWFPHSVPFVRVFLLSFPAGEEKKMKEQKTNKNKKRRKGKRSDKKLKRKEGNKAMKRRTFPPVTLIDQFIVCTELFMLGVRRLRMRQSSQFCLALLFGFGPKQFSIGSGGKHSSLTGLCGDFISQISRENNKFPEKGEQQSNSFGTFQLI